MKTSIFTVHTAVTSKETKTMYIEYPVSVEEVIARAADVLKKKRKDEYERRCGKHQ